MSRTKGCAGEREAAAELRKLGFTTARRGRQFSGSPNSPDVADAIPGVHIEVKRTEALQLYPALDQAKGDAGGAVPVVLHRRNHKPWVVVVELDHIVALAALVHTYFVREDAA